MDGFSNLDETQSQSSVAFNTATVRQRLESVRQTWQTRTTMEKGLLITVVALFVLALGLIIGLAASAGNNNDKTHEPSPLPEICLTPACTMAASRILESLDRSVNPCSDFYAYACGTWKKTHVIPEDSSSTDLFSILRDKIQMINKNLYEDPNNVAANEDAWRKAKDGYALCMDTDLLEQKNLSVITSVLEALGGWPILGAQAGGKWNVRRFDLVALLVQLAQYGIQPIMSLNVVLDSKNSTQRILQLEQSFDGYPSNEEAYLTFGKSIARLFGANPTQANTDMRQVLEFERKLNSITMSKEDLQNPDITYNKMTLAEIRENFTEPSRTDPIQFNWSNYVRGITGLEGVKVGITDKEPIVVTTVPFIKNLFGVLQLTPKRTIVNFIIWSFIQYDWLFLALPVRFKEIHNQYQKDIFGQLTTKARWRECEGIVTGVMGLAVGQKFVDQEFDDTARQRAAEMIQNIRIAFNELLHEVGWMDDYTKGLAKQKAEAIKNWIGYPDNLLNDTFINWIYKDVIVDEDAFLLNILNFLKVVVIKSLKQLREPYDKTSAAEVWSMSSPPTSVNAFYMPARNDIMIPAGILLSPFYGKNHPQSLNYGGIGTVIGHEITHGFDNTGRRYNKYGDLKQWWSRKIIDNFNRQATCMVNQYGTYVVPEANMTIDGNLTLGENIADNGGLKQSYRAYRRWVQDQGKEEPKLPGLDLTHDQLFYVSFAQLWCSNIKKQSAQLQILNNEHSPNHFRVIGSLQNSKEFAAAFSCPRKSYMNPEKKCSVW